MLGGSYRFFLNFNNVWRRQRCDADDDLVVSWRSVPDEWAGALAGGSPSITTSVSRVAPSLLTERGDDDVIPFLIMTGDDDGGR